MLDVFYGWAMKISAIETSIVALPFTMNGPYTKFSGKLWNHLEILLVKIETDNGLIGWGEAFGHAAIPSTKAAIDTIIAPLMIGRDASDINGITRSILHATHLLGRNGSFVFGFSGIEIALWDLAGKNTGQPIWRLLGGSQKSTLPAYASLLCYTDPARVAENVKKAIAQGYKYIKLHEVTRDATLAALAVCHGSTAKIMLDVNCAWSPVDALDQATSMENDGLYWLEEPVWPPEDVDGLARVRQRGIPIAAGENVAGVFGFKSLIKAHAIDIAQPSVTKIGGIGETVNVIKLAQTHGIGVQLHCPYFGPGLLASYHIAAAMIENPLIEILWIDMEANPFDPWMKVIDGKVNIPNAPGLGVDPDIDILKKYQIGETIRII
jgi:D-galactarolactone cycloisomerase